MITITKIFLQISIDVGEAEIAAQFQSLTTPGICRVYGVCDNGSGVWIVMEFHPLKDLAVFLMTLEEPLSTAHQIFLCDSANLAVSSLHSKDILHRDIKSDNFLMSAGGQLILGDFGTSQSELHGGNSVGTPQYAAPEILKQTAKWTKASDIYSLAVVFLQIVSKGLPFADISGERPKIPADCPTVCFH